MGNADGKEKSQRKQKESQEPTGMSYVFDELRKLQTKPKNVLTVERSDLIGSALPYFKTPGCEHSPLDINMTTQGVEEQSTDLGQRSKSITSDEAPRNSKVLYFLIDKILYTHAKINHAESEEKLIDALDTDSERFIDNSGWPRYQRITMKNRLQLAQSLLRWELIGKRATVLNQLKAGLNTFNFLDRTADIIDSNQVLLHTNAEKATAEYLKSRLKKELEKLKPMDENEENAKKFTKSCMEMMTDTEATHLFHFITGMSSLPVEDVPLEVEFNRSNKSAELPEAITCIQRLKIPLGNESPMALYSSFHKALSVGRYGFSGKES